MKRLVLPAMLAIAIAALLCGCAITSGNARGPDGTPVVYIDGMTASVAYGRANERCPGGYTILGEPRQTSPLDYEMTVECKPERDDVRNPPVAVPVQEMQTIRYRCTDANGQPYVTNAPTKGCVVD